MTKIKETEIRPEALFSRFTDLSRKDALTFFKSDSFGEVVCPGCHSNAVTEDGFTKDSFTYKNCAACGSLYASPRPNAAEMQRFYSESPSQKFWADEVLKQTGQKRRQTITLPSLERVDSIVNHELNSKHKTILDVGAANGAFLKGWKDRHPEAELLAIEPGGEGAQRCRDLGIKVFEGMLENEAFKPDAVADIVTCFEVLEHVQNPEQFARGMFEVTAPGGVAVMSCLGADGFDIQVLWEKSRAIHPPYHLNFLSKIGFERLFTKVGFDEVKIFSPGRLDVEFVGNSIQRGDSPLLSRFEKLLISRSAETLIEFQEFLAKNQLSSHVWIVGRRNISQ